MTREEEYAQWLPENGVTKAVVNYVGSLNIIEERLSELGSPCSSLEEAWAEDGFGKLLQKLDALKQNAEAGGTDSSELFPDSGHSPKYLGNLKSYLKKYAEYLDAESVPDADRIRSYVFEKYIVPARDEGLKEVEVPAREVHDAVGLKGRFPNVDQSLTGNKFRSLAGIEEVERIGPVGSSTTRFRFRLDKDAISLSVNLILYGPPGTGKTYTTAREAVRLCGENVPEDPDALMRVYRQLCDAKRIEFVTFHQSTAYEEFVEGLRPTTDTDGESEERTHSGFRLEPVPGIFRRIAARAEKSRAVPPGGVSIEGRRVFKLSIGDTRYSEELVAFEESLAEGYAYFGHRDIDLTDDKYANKDEIQRAYEATGDEEDPAKYRVKVSMQDTFRNKIKQGDILVIAKGNRFFRAIGVVEGDYEYHPLMSDKFFSRRKMRWLWSDDGVSVKEIYSDNFTQRTVYELARDKLNVSVLENHMNSGLELESDDQGKLPHVLIIDEINRANISRVFGELITLLEPDKRISADNELLVTLPYSGDRFGVPANLHVIGTMNTADRSIALLDTALRRRFQFRELMPDPKLVPDNVDGINLQELLTVLNERIEYLHSREHQIGHAFFMKCETRADVDAVMRDKVIPLLAEYFFEDWDKMAAVLGDAGIADNTEGGFLRKTALKPPSGLRSEQGTRHRWSVRSEGFDYSRLGGLPES